MKYLVGMCLLICSHACLANEINIYVRYDTTELNHSINHFNQFLKKKGLFARYSITPFLHNFPLHTTLYLADFQPQSIPRIIRMVEQEAARIQPFIIQTGDIHINANYVMMDVAKSGLSGQNSDSLRKLSNQIVTTLSSLRNQKASIPAWAKNSPQKKSMFNQYGSPNVFTEFSPHFTLMAKHFDNAATARQFYEKTRQLIRQYQQQYPNRHLWVQAVGIGIGYVNQYGQITRQIAYFDFRQTGITRQLKAGRQSRKFGVSISAVGI